VLMGFVFQTNLYTLEKKEGF